MVTIISSTICLFAGAFIGVTIMSALFIGRIKTEAAENEKE